MEQNGNFNFVWNWSTLETYIAERVAYMVTISVNFAENSAVL